eukprot:m.322717 g.322717  ORF g.322717 m.322717 type:complete len:53 (+) comp19719_c1_seq2:1065-1223(+)
MFVVKCCGYVCGPLWLCLCLWLFVFVSRCFVVTLARRSADDVVRTVCVLLLL